ncbi:MAG: asparagine synthase (glutamine-hydrolyzing) [Rhodospirillales bacterium]|nr:asparagine synthase (glutamine-hydrolyzing) [Rhodospirillales bacterium]
MCGIAGFIGKVGPDRRQLRRALETMRHRGPDAAGVCERHLGPQRAVLLHSRLAILDLDPRSNQPFEKDDCALIFNGEIYNHIEIRRELEHLGHSFRTGSDTEVIIDAWREWGRRCFDRFEGMWALALHDSRSQQVIMSRDRFGEKPLHLLRTEDGLFFASEVKTLWALSGAAPKPDLDQVRRYLVQGYRVLHKKPRSFFGNVAEFPAASLMEIDVQGKEDTSGYWRLEYRPQLMSSADAIDGARARLFESVRLRLRADVPLSFCLSGGVDSGALAAIAALSLGTEIETFSIIDSDPRYDESENIAITSQALGCKNHRIPTRKTGFLDRMANLVRQHDAPVATISYYMHSFLSEAIHEAGFKVAVSGTGADEIFLGYYDHSLMWLAAMQGREDFASLVESWRNGYGAHVRNPMLQDPQAFIRDPGMRSHLTLGAAEFASYMTAPFGEAFAEESYCPELLRNRMMNELLCEVVPVILAEDDLNSMMHSIENRSPFLDRRLVEFLFSVPNAHLMRDGYTKWLLRESVKDLLPDAVRLDRRKRGFNASIDSLLDRKDPDVVERLLAPGPIFDLVRRQAIEDYLRRDLEANELSKFMFSFVSAKFFLDQAV